MFNSNLLPNTVILLIIICASYYLLFNKDLSSFCYAIINGYSVSKDTIIGYEIRKNIKDECLNNFKFEALNSIFDIYRFQEFKKIIIKFMFDPNLNYQLLLKKYINDIEYNIILYNLRILEIAIMIIYISCLYIILIVFPIYLIKFIFNIIINVFSILILIFIMFIIFNNSKLLSFNINNDDISKIISNFVK